MSARHTTRICPARNFPTEWSRLVDELARRGVLSGVGAADALLAAAPGRPVMAHLRPDGPQTDGSGPTEASPEGASPDQAGLGAP